MEDRRILITDPIADQGVELLKEHADVEIRADIDHRELREIIGTFDGLIVRSGTIVDTEVIQNGVPRLKVVGRAGTGVDNIDLETSKQCGVLVVNTPGANTVSVAEHAIALMLSLARNITQANKALKEGRWERKKYRGREVKGKTLGIIGLGRAGSEVARRAKGLEMKVLAYDAYVSESRGQELGVKMVDLDHLISAADFITLHVPLTEETRYMIDERELAMMKEGVFIVNCARGKIVNEEALSRALEEGRVAGAALDVFETEPLHDSPLIDQENAILIPHLGASTREAMNRVAVEVAQQVLDVLNDNFVSNAVNVPEVSDEDFNVLKPFMPLAERLGSFYGQWLDAYIDEIEISYGGRLAGQEVRLLTSCFLKGLLDPILEEPVNAVNASLIAEKRGISVIETTRKNEFDYANIIKVAVKTDKGTDSFAGSLFRKEDYRLVMFDEYSIDSPLEGIMLVAYHLDQPGIIGQVGTILGKYDINIAKMQVGRKQPGGMAVMILGVDSEIPEGAFARILEVKGIHETRMVKI